MKNLGKVYLPMRSSENSINRGVALEKPKETCAADKLAKM
jgi:hypothetical protein